MSPLGAPDAQDSVRTTALQKHLFSTRCTGSQILPDFRITVGLLSSPGRIRTNEIRVSGMGCCV